MLDGRYLDSLVRFVFDSIIINTFGHYLAGLIKGSFDILFAELSDIYKGLLPANVMNIDELVFTLILYIVSTSSHAPKLDIILMLH
jgi:hypothetical protein